jgi:hypothetical protein
MKVSKFAYTLLLLVFSATLYAGNTGKIAGIVVDRASGEPLAGANVIVEARWENEKEIPLDVPTGASTDIDGAYFILNLHPGYYSVRATYIANQSSTHLPQQMILYQNYPNPFNSGTQIRYYLSLPTKIRLVIYNMLGQEIKTLVDKEQIQDKHIITWNGLDNSGLPVSTGVYIYQIRNSQGQEENRKMLLIK